MYKNVAGQYVAIYAHDTAADAAKTGDAANITATFSLDGDSTPGATTDANPTEIGGGVYVFAMEQSETNGDLFVLLSSSTTADIQIDPVVIYTVPGTNAGANANVTQWLGTAVATPTTAGVPTVRLSAAGVDDLWDEALEGTETGRQMMRLFRAALLGITTDAGTKFRDRANTKNRIDATLTNGNRTVITTDPT